MILETDETVYDAEGTLFLKITAVFVYILLAIAQRNLAPRDWLGFLLHRRSLSSRPYDCICSTTEGNCDGVGDQFSAVEFPPSAVFFFDTHELILSE